ncbi:MAG TPA: hypothetical protein VH418_16595 [Solirubrobacteraceae bacterium]
MPPDLERALRELEPDWPPTPDLAVAVRARLAAEPAPGRPAGGLGARLRRPGPTAPGPTEPGRGGGLRRPGPTAPGPGARLPRPHPALAAVLGALLVFGVVMAASPSARSTVLRWLGLKSVEVRQAPPAATPPPVRRGSELGLGNPVTLAAAKRAAGFPVPVPSALGPPAVVYLDKVPGTGPRVSLVYAPQAGIPRSRISGVGLLVTAFRGDPFPVIQKTIIGAHAERLTIAGSPAIWLPRAHGFAYATPGGVGFEPQRLADRTLLVERGGVLLRIEGRITRARAVAIARDALR